MKSSELLKTRDALRLHQSKRLTELLRSIVPANRFWSEKWRTAGMTLAQGERRVPGDLAKLPLLTKAELVADHAAHGPYGSNLTFEVGTYSRFCQTSGTTGEPLRWLDTTESWQWMLDCWEQIFELADVRADDRFCFPFSFGPFLGFWAAFDGAARLGRLCLPGGGMSSESRLKLIAENRATVVCCTPTYALRLAEVASELGIDLKSSSVRLLIVAGEPGGSVSSIRTRIETAWGARVIDHWGMTEVGPLAGECVENPGGLHILETECIAEIIDPVSGQSFDLDAAFAAGLQLGAEPIRG
ncbi:MAG: AMP-binding protein, partial [Planctomycetia bacterium]|nr:AMP-binding protein [Planctomycetia bacterium]